MTSIEIKPRQNLDAVVSIPGSKSGTARAMVMAALAHGRTTLSGAAECDDADRMVDGLTALGVRVVRDADAVTIDSDGLRAPGAALSLGNSGTAVRFLAAACAAVNGSVTLDGDQRMRERPISDLVAALREWGVNADSETGCPPVTIQSTGDFGGATRIAGTASSQYLSGLLIAAPYARRDVRVVVEGELVSKPYVDLTLALQAERGVSVENRDYREFVVPANQAYRPGAYAVEADASGASYFFAAAAVAGGRVRVRNITGASHQGDAQFPRVLEQMGCSITEGPDWTEVASAGNLTGIDVDLNAMPDMAQTLAVVALFADGPTTIRNVANLRIKECDRISALTTELRKLGAQVDEFPDGLRVTPGQLRPAAIDTYDDHRMAMCFAVAGLAIPGIVINDPECVAKTFPDFFQRFSQI